eukprot:scaffold3990_cov394-Prasinococcus_capsulatus_cf.AAC.1
MQPLKFDRQVKLPAAELKDLQGRETGHARDLSRVRESQEQRGKSVLVDESPFPDDMSLRVQTLDEEEAATTHTQDAEEFEDCQTAPQLEEGEDAVEPLKVAQRTQTEDAEEFEECDTAPELEATVDVAEPRQTHDVGGSQFLPLDQAEEEDDSREQPVTSPPKRRKLGSGMEEERATTSAPTEAHPQPALQVMDPRVEDPSGREETAAPAATEGATANVSVARLQPEAAPVEEPSEDEIADDPPDKQEPAPQGATVGSVEAGEGGEASMPANDSGGKPANAYQNALDMVKNFSKQALAEGVAKGDEVAAHPSHLGAEQEALNMLKGFHERVQAEAAAMEAEEAADPVLAAVGGKALMPDGGSGAKSKNAYRSALDIVKNFNKQIQPDGAVQENPDGIENEPVDGHAIVAGDADDALTQADKGATAIPGRGVGANVTSAYQNSVNVVKDFHKQVHAGGTAKEKDGGTLGDPVDENGSIPRESVKDPGEADGGDQGAPPMNTYQGVLSIVKKFNKQVRPEEPATGKEDQIVGDTGGAGDGGQGATLTSAYQNALSIVKNFNGLAQAEAAAKGDDVEDDPIDDHDSIPNVAADDELDAGDSGKAMVADDDPGASPMSAYQKALRLVKKFNTRAGAEGVVKEIEMEDPMDQNMYVPRDNVADGPMGADEDEHATFNDYENAVRMVQNYTKRLRAEAAHKYNRTVQAGELQRKRVPSIEDDLETHAPIPLEDAAQVYSEDDELMEDEEGPTVLRVVNYQTVLNPKLDYNVVRALARRRGKNAEQATLDDAAQEHALENEVHDEENEVEPQDEPSSFPAEGSGMQPCQSPSVVAKEEELSFNLLRDLMSKKRRGDPRPFRALTPSFVPDSQEITPQRGPIGPSGGPSPLGAMPSPIRSSPLLGSGLRAGASCYSHPQ